MTPIILLHHNEIDFLEKSINSIIDDVDMIFIYWSKQPWYKECKDLPPMNEYVGEFCKRWSNNYQSA